MRAYVAASLAGLLVFAIGCAVGRWAAPTKVEWRERVVEKLVEVESEKKETKRDGSLALEAKHHETLRFRRVRKPDGTVVDDLRRDRGATAAAAGASSESRVETKIEYRDRVVEVERFKVVEAKQPYWSAGARLGLSLSPRPVYGGVVERRLAGPFWIGAWADTTKAAGLSLRVEW